jgi:hypothetical protein
MKNPAEKLKEMIGGIFIPVFLVLLIPVGIIIAGAFKLLGVLNYFSTRLFGWGSFGKRLCLDPGEEIPDAFNALVREDTVLGKVTVTFGRVLSCGCIEPQEGKETMSVLEAREYLKEEVRIAKKHFNDYIGGGVTKYTFKVKDGEMTIAYPVIIYGHDESPLPRISYKYDSFNVYFRGIKKVFEELIKNGREEGQAALLRSSAKASRVASS